MTSNNIFIMCTEQNMLIYHLPLVWVQLWTHRDALLHSLQFSSYTLTYLRNSQWTQNIKKTSSDISFLKMFVFTNCSMVHRNSETSLRYFSKESAKRTCVLY